MPACWQHLFFLSSACLEVAQSPGGVGHKCNTGKMEEQTFKYIVIWRFVSNLHPGQGLSKGQQSESLPVCLFV